MSSSGSMSFGDYTKKLRVARGAVHTHTRIPDKKTGITGGIFNITAENEKTFLKNYYTHVFKKGNFEYLTEKQLKDDGPLLVDIDLRYLPDVKQRQHTPEHIIDLIMMYFGKIEEIYNISDCSKVDVFVQEKTDVNQLEDKTKDGIHIIFGIKMERAVQVMLREMILPEMKTIWEDLPITNTWDEVLDEGITKGTVNWQLYGSRKPGNKAYLVKNHYVLNYQSGEWTIETSDMNLFKTEKMLHKLSARYSEHPSWELNEKMIEKIEKYKIKSNSKKLHVVGKKSLQRGQFVRYDTISSEEQLDEMIAMLFEDISPVQHIYKETHEYTMSLPKEYYGKGSYNKWIRVGWALANTSPKLFLSWLKFSCQEGCRDTLCGTDKKFDWNKVSELFEIWQGFDFDNPDALTHRSIMYWSKSDAKEKYDQIRKNTIDYFIEQTIITPKQTEFDLAAVLHSIYKDRFSCVSIRNNCWYEYKNNRWHEIDSGNTLRLLISQDMHQLYVNKVLEHTTKYELMEQSDDSSEQIRKRTSKLAEIALSLKKTQWKNNIMREARELFYDKDFITKLDQNPYLLCFNNCVVDFKQMKHRKGQPDDYISKSTNIDYIPLSKMKNKTVIADIKTFMEQLFPNEELCKYMWEHLASCCVGTNENQTFNIYNGSGRNGKSMLVELMTKCLGDYKGTVPITLITQKRNSIGSTSSEIVQLMGTRYAVMQEPSKNDRINEGIMKEITGGDPIQGRALFKDTVTFVPQFKLVVCTNTMFDIMTDDDGTWRRIRKCNFDAKFLENPYKDEFSFPKEDYPYQFKVDKNLNSKFNDWAPVLMSMLVDISYKKQGNVTDCDVVMQASREYREGQDRISGFAKDKIQKKDGGKIKKSELVEEFRKWYVSYYGRGNKEDMPRGTELTSYMNKKYGKYRQGWHNVEIIYDEDELVEDM